MSRRKVIAGVVTIAVLGVVAAFALHGKSVGTSAHLPEQRLTDAGANLDHAERIRSIALNLRIGGYMIDGKRPTVTEALIASHGGSIFKRLEYPYEHQWKLMVDRSAPTWFTVQQNGRYEDGLYLAVEEEWRRYSRSLSVELSTVGSDLLRQAHEDLAAVVSESSTEKQPWRHEIVAEGESDDYSVYVTILDYVESAEWEQNALSSVQFRIECVP